MRSRPYAVSGRRCIIQCACCCYEIHESCVFRAWNRLHWQALTPHAASRLACNPRPLSNRRLSPAALSTIGTAFSHSQKIARLSPRLQEMAPHSSRSAEFRPSPRIWCALWRLVIQRGTSKGIQKGKRPRRVCVQLLDKAPLCTHHFAGIIHPHRRPRVEVLRRSGVAGESLKWHLRR